MLSSAQRRYQRAAHSGFQHHNPLVSRHGAPHRARQVSARFGVRPYTLREGDTLQSITEKRGFTMKEVMKLNHNLDPNSLQAGQTIMLPLGKLSERDRQILDGMKAGNYRTYPIRAGEKLSDVLANRKISMDEFQLLNPELNPNKVKANTLIKLPARKFSQREREMLFGAGAPNDFFYQGEGSWIAPAAGFGIVVAAVVYVGMLRAGRKSIALTLNGEGRIMAVLPIFNLMRSVVDVHTFDTEYHKLVDEKTKERSMDLGDGADKGAAEGGKTPPPPIKGV